MAFFANTWINLDLKNVSNSVIIQHVKAENIIKRQQIPLKVIEHAAPKEVYENLKSAYFRDMITVGKHMKASYTKDEITKKHKKSSYVREFVETK